MRPALPLDVAMVHIIGLDPEVLKAEISLSCYKRAVEVLLLLAAFAFLGFREPLQFIPPQEAQSHCFEAIHALAALEVPLSSVLR